MLDKKQKPSKGASSSLVSVTPSLYVTSSAVRQRPLMVYICHYTVSAAGTIGTARRRALAGELGPSHHLLIWTDRLESVRDNSPDRNRRPVRNGLYLPSCFFKSMLLLLLFSSAFYFWSPLVTPMLWRRYRHVQNRFVVRVWDASTVFVAKIEITTVTVAFNGVRAATAARHFGSAFCLFAVAHQLS